jgi:hypothetical protein
LIGQGYEQVSAVVGPFSAGLASKALMGGLEAALDMAEE